MGALIFGVLFLLSAIGCGVAGYLYFKAQEKSTQLEVHYNSEIERITNEVQNAYYTRLTELENEGEALRQHYEGEAARVTAEAQQSVDWMSDQLAELQQYANLIQSGQQVEELCKQAIAEAEELKARAVASVEVASNYAQELNDNASSEADGLIEEARALVEQTNREATRIIEDAYAQAEETNSDAFNVSQDIHSSQSALKAIKNQIKGYGDRYVLPTRGMLDELAEGYGHTAAGEAFKIAKSETERMVLEGEAASCDYAEMSRKETAVRCLIDAFNGRVDAILNKANHDNFGTLKQQIEDAASLVNLNGQAFRNARINEGYLENRIEELKWATVLYELRKKVREEQAEIRAQMREEARLRQEQQLLEREAERERQIANEAMEKAKARYELASNEERSQMEAEMEKLRQQLEEAESKNQRAISLAQQTRAGHVYIISNIGSFGDNVYKIGMTRRQEPQDRVKELSDASVPFEFDVHAMITCEDAPALESELQKRFDDQRVNMVNTRKEFFRVSLSEIKGVVDEMGLNDVYWTMAAEAREYRETSALNNPDRFNEDEGMDS